MEQHYTLTRVMLSGDDEPIGSTSFTVSDADAVNCAYMLAAGFNTMSRNFMQDCALGVVAVKTGSVQYDGKIEKFDRPDPHTVSTSFKFEGSLDPDNMVTIFDNENGRLMFPGKFKFPEPSKYEHVSREVLEAAYGELEDVKSVLFDAGVETIPADAGVKDLSTVLFARDEKIAELYSDLNKLAHECEELRKRDEFERHARQSMEAQHAQANETARAEMISFVKRAHAKKVKLQTAVPDGDGRPELDDRWRGMLDVLAKFLVVTGEADASEGHAVARRLCGISDE